MTTRRSRPPRARKTTTRESKPPVELVSGDNPRSSGIELRGAGDASAVDELALIEAGWDELLA
jgi:hypothetical protein